MKNEDEKGQGIGGEMKHKNKRERWKTDDEDDEEVRSV